MIRIRLLVLDYDLVITELQLRVLDGVVTVERDFSPADVVTTTSRAAVAASEPAGAPGPDPVDRIDGEVGLSAREKAVLTKIIHTDLTLQQIATALSREYGERVTYPSVKHALARVMGKLHLEPRTRAALVKRVLNASRR